MTSFRMMERQTGMSAEWGEDKGKTAMVAREDAYRTLEGKRQSVN